MTQKLSPSAAVLSLALLMAWGVSARAAETARPADTPGPSPTATPAPLASTPTPTPPPTPPPTIGLTEGWTRYNSGYKVQNWTASPLEERFTFVDEIYQTRVFAGERRVEMRWDGWSEQNRENMWDGDILFDSDTQKTCIMQIKSNTGGEPIYLQVSTPGTIRNDNDRTPLATNMANTWFNWKAALNPTTGVARAWINDSLVKTRQYDTASRDWYFKNGCYNNGLPERGRSLARFKNIKFWVK